MNKVTIISGEMPEPFVIGDYVYEWKPTKDIKTAKRQAKFYSDIAQGKKAVYRTTFWTRVKDWLYR